MPSPKLFAAILTRNEGSRDRFLSAVLARCTQICDEIVVLDDGSTDQTVETCKGFGAEVTIRDAHVPRAWGEEASARAELWDLATARCTEKDWILVADADMVLHGDPRPLMASRDVNAWAWRLYDVWSEKHFRDDQYWQGHNHARVWMVAPKRVPNGWTPSWERTGLHVGHIPPNLPMIAGLPPPDIYWLHLAFSRPDLRQKKAEQYLSKSHLLSEHEIAHAKSILEEP